MLENILTHPTSRLTGIDVFPNDTEQKYLNNLKLSGLEHKVTTYKRNSWIQLRYLPLESFDIIYIDGNHRAHSVLTDAVLSWGLLKKGGILIFDDYKWHMADRPDVERPQMAIDAFTANFQRFLEVISQSRQVIVRKRENPIPVLKKRISDSPI